jgi:hypothetical protein
MIGDYHVRFCERLGLKCPCLLDTSIMETIFVHQLFVDKSKIYQVVDFAKEIVLGNDQVVQTRIGADLQFLLLS